MKLILVLLQLCISSIAFSQKQANDSITKTDSLSFFYDVRKMTIIVNDTSVQCSVVFDLEKGFIRKEYRYMSGALSTFKAIKRFGEKYRNGILIYRKED